MHLGQSRTNAPGFNRRSVIDIMGNVKHTAPLERKRGIIPFSIDIPPRWGGSVPYP